VTDNNKLNIVPLNPDIERIKALMENPPEGSVVLTITPDVARYILLNWRGRHNRREKPAAVRRYANDMADPSPPPEGWLLNGSTVVFTDQHLLGDGQNRMIACIRANQPFTTHIIFGVPHEYFFSMDQGRVRGPGDVLEIEGVANAKIVAQAVRWAELLETSKVFGRTVFTGKEILDLYRKKHKTVEDFLPEARAIFRLNRQPLPVVMAVLYTFDKIDSDLAAEYSRAWAEGTYSPRFASIGTMQTEIERIKRLSTGRVHEAVRLAIIINSWNSVRIGLKGRLGKIKWDKSKPFPRIR
jgi:hypothetical protein